MPGWKHALGERIDQLVVAAVPHAPNSSKHPDVRYLDIHEQDDVDEHQLSSSSRSVAVVCGR